MTEQRAIEVLEYAKTFDGMDFGATKIALDMAIKALEEIQQYRAIGTVEGYERAIQSSIENYNLYREYKAKVQEFESIGTVEELQALKEKKEHKHTYENCHNLTCRRKCEKDGYNKAIDEFAERLHKVCGIEIGNYQYTDILHESHIDEIADSMKMEK